MNASNTTPPNSNASQETAANAAGTPDAGAAADSVLGSAEVDFSSEFAKLEAALREANDRNLRTQAELENFRKRARRELEEEKRYAALPLMRDVLQVVDNLQRAIEAAEKSQSGAALLEGVKMVAVQLASVLEQHHCRTIPAAGAAFDPQWHEAIGQMPSADVAAGHVALVARSGYTLHDRVVRPAQVLVSLGAPAAPASDNS